MDSLSLEAAEVLLAVARRFATEDASVADVEVAIAIWRGVHPSPTLAASESRARAAEERAAVETRRADANEAAGLVLTGHLSEAVRLINVLTKEHAPRIAELERAAGSDVLARLARAEAIEGAVLALCEPCAEVLDFKRIDMEAAEGEALGFVERFDRTLRALVAPPPEPQREGR